MGMIGHFGVGPFGHVWRLMTIVIHLLQVHWLTLNRYKMSVDSAFYHQLPVACNSGLLLLICEDEYVEYAGLTSLLTYIKMWSSIFKKSSFQVLNQFQRTSFIGEFPQTLMTFLIKSFLDYGHLSLRKLRSSNVPRSDFHMQPDREWSLSIPFSFHFHFGFVLEPNPFRVQKLNLFPDCHWKLHLVAFCNGHSCCSVYRSKTRIYPLEN
jgi:hypothetical protein